MYPCTNGLCSYQGQIAGSTTGYGMEYYSVDLSELSFDRNSGIEVVVTTLSANSAITVYAEQYAEPSSYSYNFFVNATCNDGIYTCSSLNSSAVCVTDTTATWYIGVESLEGEFTQYTITVNIANGDILDFTCYANGGNLLIIVYICSPIGFVCCISCCLGVICYRRRRNNYTVYKEYEKVTVPQPTVQVYAQAPQQYPQVYPGAPPTYNTYQQPQYPTAPPPPYTQTYQVY